MPLFDPAKLRKINILMYTVTFIQEKMSSFACIRGQDTAKDGKEMLFAEAINDMEALPHIGHWKNITSLQFLVKLAQSSTKHEMHF